MMKTELSRPYLSIEHNGSPSYGGSQSWFPGMLRICGCSVTGAADLLWYLNRGSSMTEEQYKRYVGILRRSFFLIPFRGIPGTVMAVLLNRYMKKHGMPYRAHWGAGHGGIIKRIRAMIREDIPVPLCVGPCIHQFFNQPLYRGLKLYKKARNTAGEPYVWTSTVKNHFMVITGLEGRYARLASLGEEYYIELEELRKLSAMDAAGLYTNIIRIMPLSRRRSGR